MAFNYSSVLSVVVTIGKVDPPAYWWGIDRGCSVTNLWGLMKVEILPYHFSIQWEPYYLFCESHGVGCNSWN